MAVHSNADYHVLVTDRAPAGESLWAVLLASVGYRVSCVRDSIEAAGVLQPNPADLAILAVSSGDTVELGLLGMVRKFFPDMPVLVCTAEMTVAEQAHFEQLGVAEVLANPVDPRLLLSCVEQILHARHKPLATGAGGRATAASLYEALAAGALAGGDGGASEVPIRVGHSPEALQVNADFARLRGFTAVALMESRAGLGVLDLAVALARPAQALMVACLAGWINREVLTELLEPARHNERPVVLVVLESEQLDSPRQALLEDLLTRRDGNALSECFAGRVRVLLCAVESLSDRAERGGFSELLLMQAGMMVQQVPALVRRRADLWVMALAVWMRTGCGAVAIDPTCADWVQAQPWAGDYAQFHRAIELAGRWAQQTGVAVSPQGLARAVAAEAGWVQPLYHERLMTELAGPLVVWD